MKNGDGAFHLFRRSVIDQPQRYDAFDCLAAGNIFDCGVGCGFVRDRHQKTVRRAQPGAAQPDPLHGAFLAVDADKVIDLERPVDDNH